MVENQSIRFEVDDEFKKRLARVIAGTTIKAVGTKLFEMFFDVYEKDSAILGLLLNNKLELRRKDNAITRVAS